MINGEYLFKFIKKNHELIYNNDWDEFFERWTRFIYTNYTIYGNDVGVYHQLSLLMKKAGYDDFEEFTLKSRYKALLNELDEIFEHVVKHKISGSLSYFEFYEITEQLAVQFGFTEEEIMSVITGTDFINQVCSKYNLSIDKKKQMFFINTFMGMI